MPIGAGIIMRVCIYHAISMHALPLLLTDGTPDESVRGKRCDDDPTAAYAYPHPHASMQDASNGGVDPCARIPLAPLKYHRARFQRAASVDLTLCGFQSSQPPVRLHPASKIASPPHMINALT